MADSLRTLYEHDHRYEVVRYRRPTVLGLNCCTGKCHWAPTTH
ncbi:hypothetical protein [Streptomyces chartreusis]